MSSSRVSAPRGEPLEDGSLELGPSGCRFSTHKLEVGEAVAEADMLEVILLEEEDVERAPDDDG